MKTLYQICKNKVEVDLSKAYQVQDIDNMLEAVVNGKVDWHIAQEIASVLIDVKKAVVKAYEVV